MGATRTAEGSPLKQFSNRVINNCMVLVVRLGVAKNRITGQFGLSIKLGMAICKCKVKPWLAAIFAGLFLQSEVPGTRKAGILHSRGLSH